MCPSCLPALVAAVIATRMGCRLGLRQDHVASIPIIITLMKIDGDQEGPQIEDASVWYGWCINFQHCGCSDG